jgi:hypothetical protein
VRSTSPDIADDINREIAETGLRLANLAQSSGADNTMTVESMRHEEDSQRSQSSDGSLNKRAIKSNVALQNKRNQIKN